MKITISGDVREYKDGLILSELANCENLDIDEINAITINEEVVDKKNLDITVLHDGDEVEFMLDF
ncbi:MAG: thiamine biosynthesis protein ThiS [Agathobacter sp.]|nr:thiamine biosynthesis protein ThiS [Agathobacter sp.]